MGIDIHPKVGATAIGGALGTLIVGTVNHYISNLITPDMSMALVTLLGVLAGYMTRSIPLTPVVAQPTVDKDNIVHVIQPAPVLGKSVTIPAK